MVGVEDLNPIAQSGVTLGGIGLALLIFFLAILVVGYDRFWSLDVYSEKAIKIYNPITEKDRK